ncbi:iron ABC transporter substrate-binding protein [Desulfoferrobacter suflitae]|uniref:iron ABC transporter substrate-binding protein n=1 Tax=Desulfoferrobacter suflitae TaxID=2865782 RepID=UPI002164A514|nr:iron ABC transporter substrate-binding protein [Desulfoferrobacter suflitae]MCK8603658.1 iron ABC transporter substrate-binding protein [Desulfoferrobacter suflitae]
MLYSLLTAAALVFVLLRPGLSWSQEVRTITDAAGRVLSIPQKVTRVICSGAGCLRLLTYLQVHDRIVAVDSIELRGSPIDARPYAIANPRFKNYPLFGEFRGLDNPELIAGLDPQPQVIFKTFVGTGQDPDRVQVKTGIPVVTLEYGNLTYGRQKLNQSLRLMAAVMGVERRAEEVIAYFDALEGDIRKRTGDVPLSKRPSCYIGGLGQSGPHGLQSTEPSFAPFVFTHATNVAADLSSRQKLLSHATVAKEQIVVWDPQVIFVDVSTMRLDPSANALDQLRSDPVYHSLTAVRDDRVYGLFPYNSYNQNFEAVFANAYFVGKVLYPERFSDLDPMAKAEEIAVFLNGGQAFEQLNREFDGLAFSRIQIGY